MGTVHLGPIGASVTPLDMDFEMCGTTIRVHPLANDLDMTEFIAKAANISVEDGDEKELRRLSSEGMQALMSFMRQQIHPDDWNLFWGLAKSNGMSTADVMEVSKKITEAVANFRSGPSSDSSRGRPTTGRKSKARSSGKGGKVTPIDKAIRLYDGRPDLQLMLIRSKEETAATG